MQRKFDKKKEVIKNTQRNNESLYATNTYKLIMGISAHLNTCTSIGGYKYVKKFITHKVNENRFGCLHMTIVVRMPLPGNGHSR